MAVDLFVSMGVRDLARSRAFFSALGFSFNPQFSGDKTLCIVVADNILVMLLQDSFFQTFTDKQVADAKQCVEMALGLARDSRAAVDDIVARAVAAGGRALGVAQDYGFMYQHGFEDLDGHTWDFSYWDSTAQPLQA